MTLRYQPDERVQAYGEPFLLYGGLGPEIHLLSDGRVIVDERAFFGTEVREASEDEAIAGIVVGAKKTGIASLLEVLPPSPPDAPPCTRCAGSRWWTVLPGSNSFQVICPECHGRGWAPP